MSGDPLPGPFSLPSIVTLPGTPMLQRRRRRSRLPRRAIHSCHRFRIGSKKMQEDSKPKMGMVFDSFEDAWKFWVDYGGRVGFGVRKQYSHKKKDGSTASCRFVCSKEGLRKADKRDFKTINPRPETRTNCQARLGLKHMGEKFIVHDFVEEHNHILHLQETTHMLSSQRKVSEDEKDIKIRELTAELQRERKRSAAFKEQLKIALRDLEEHSNYLSRTIDDIVQCVREMELKRVALPQN